MVETLSDLRNKFRRENIAIQFIYINIAIFLIISLIKLGLYLFNLDINWILDILSLPASLKSILYKPWTIISYMFMHNGILHILFNMLLLYWFGQFFLHYFSAKHLRGLYILGGIIGGLFFVIAYNLFPIFKPLTSTATLLGASAAVLAIVIASACRNPNQEVRLLLIGSIKLKYIALFVIAIDLLTITSDNPGGHIAHLGGAFSGYIFAMNLAKGRDLTLWINNIIDFPLFISHKIKERKKKKKMKVVYKANTKRQDDYVYNAEKKAASEEIDKILDKIKESGYHNLTDEEKQKLFNASK